MLARNETQEKIALNLARLGYFVFPVCSKTYLDEPTGRLVQAKHPFPYFKWRVRSTNDPDKIRALWDEYPDGAVAIDCGKSGLYVVDGDRHGQIIDGATVDGVMNWRSLFEIMGGAEAPLFIAQTPSSGEHWYFRQRAGREPLRNSEGRLALGVDTRGMGGLVLASGAVTEAGEYVPAVGKLLPVASLPEVPDWLYEWFKPQDRKPAKPALSDTDRARELLRLKSALPFVPAETRETWRNVGMAIKWALGDDGFSLWDDWSQNTSAGNYNANTQQAQWDSFASYGGEEREGCGVVDLGTVFQLSRTGGWQEHEDVGLREGRIAQMIQSCPIVLPSIAPGYPQDGRGKPAAPESSRAAMNGAQKKAGLVVRCAADITPEPIDWAWKNHFARGKLNLVAGLSGLGKSQLFLDFTATITQGGAWPDGSPCPRKSEVLLVQNEDDAADTVVPRALAAGVEMRRLKILDRVCVDEGEKGFVERLIKFDTDREMMETFLDENPDVDTLVIDPLNAYLGKADSYKDAEVRAVLTPLAELASRRKLLIILLMHLNKHTNRTAADRIAGSGAFLQIVRTAHMVATDTDDEDVKIFQTFKRNIGTGFEGYAFRIVTEYVYTESYPDGIETSRAKWEGVKTLEDLGEALEGKKKEESPSRQEEAEQFLQYELRHEAKLQHTLEKASAEMGIRGRTLRRAKEKLGVKSFKAADGLWWWRFKNQESDAVNPANFAGSSQAKQIELPVM